MRELTIREMGMVAGGTGECTAETSGNNYGGVTDTRTVGQELTNFYEGLVEVTSYIIERVANAL
jgi:hypothetical protein